MDKQLGKPPITPPDDGPTADWPAQNEMRERLVQAYFAAMQRMNHDILAVLAEDDDGPTKGVH